jgi:hypothetical protein
MPTLSQLNQDADYLIKLINQCEGDDELTSLLETELDTKFKEISEKIDAYIYVSRMLESEAEFLSTEGKRMKELADQKRKVSKRLKNTIINTMSNCGVKKQSTNYYSLTIASNPVPTFELADIEEFPEEFLLTETVVKIDKDKVKKSIDDNGFLYNRDGKIIAKVYKGKHLRVR